nr:SEL1-like repeat protein [Helicobacter rodentium]
MNLGYLYFEGKGVRQDYQVAKDYYGKACDLGLQQGCDAYKNLN